MTTETNYKENLGYRQHSAIANSDLAYLYNPKKFKANKEGLITKTEKDFQTIGTAFEDWLNVGIKHTEEDFFNKYYILNSSLETPGHPNQTQFCQILFNKEFFDENDIVEAYGQSYSKPDETKALELYNKLSAYISFLSDSKGKIILKEDEFETIKRMKESAISLPVYKELFDTNGLEILPSKTLGIEKPINIYGINWKGELDYLIFDHINKEIYIVDVKTTGFDLAFFGYSIKKYKYYRQLANYYNLVKEFIKDTKYENWFIYVRILAVETTGYNDAAIIPIPANILEKGFQELEEAAEIIKQYRISDFTLRQYQKADGSMFIDWNKLDIIEPEETT